MTSEPWPTGWVGVRAVQKEREGTKGAGSRRKRTVYSNLLPLGERRQETQPLFRSVLNMVHGPVLTGGKRIDPYNREVGRALNHLSLGFWVSSRKWRSSVFISTAEAEGLIVQRSTTWCIWVLPLVGNSLPSAFLAPGDAHPPWSGERVCRGSQGS